MLRHAIGILLTVLLLCTQPQQAFSQLTLGTTGLLNMPTAEMQKDKTLMVGGNYLNKAITPPVWDYGTYNYFVNITFLPWFEASFVSTLFSAKSLGFKFKGYSNQDRHFAFRIRAIKEGQFWRHMPALVLGTADPYTEAGDGTTGNGYFNRFYVAGSKHLNLLGQTFGVHLTYLWTRRKDIRLKGLAVGLAWDPSFARNLRVIAEYDTKDFLMGASYLLFNHLHLQVEMQRLTRFSGGLTYKVCLK